LPPTQGRYCKVNEHHLTVKRTARYFTLGEFSEQTREVWFVCHGYGQLAEYFIRNFKILDDGSRLIVAPEALSRFYLTSAFERIGATWMTREDRLNEIHDYVNYLDLLYDEIFSRIDRNQVKVTVLGFSQGTATVCRWISRGKIRPERLILWAGLIPPELDLEAEREIYANLDFVMVLGSKDEFAKPEVIAEQDNRLKAHKIPFRFIGFEGGHVIHPETLKKLVGSDHTF
jgi:predicted esterase